MASETDTWSKALDPVRTLSKRQEKYSPVHHYWHYWIHTIFFRNKRHCCFKWLFIICSSLSNMRSLRKKTFFFPKVLPLFILYSCQAMSINVITIKKKRHLELFFCFVFFVPVFESAFALTSSEHPPGTRDGAGNPLIGPEYHVCGFEHNSWSSPGGVHTAGEGLASNVRATSCPDFYWCHYYSEHLLMHFHKTATWYFFSTCRMITTVCGTLWRFSWLLSAACFR